MKNGFISLISRLNINQGEKISEFEDPKLKCIKKKEKYSIQKLWDNFKMYNIVVIIIPEGEREKE